MHRPAGETAQGWRSGVALIPGSARAAAQPCAAAFAGVTPPPPPITTTHPRTHHAPPAPRLVRLVGETWLFLEPECVAEVMDNLRHLIPSRAPRDLLLDDPTWLLRAQRGQRWLGAARVG